MLSRLIRITILWGYESIVPAYRQLVSSKAHKRRNHPWQTEKVRTAHKQLECFGKIGESNRGNMDRLEPSKVTRVLYVLHVASFLNRRA